MNVGAFLQERYLKTKTYIAGFLKWLILAVVIGIVCGLVGTAFHKCVEYATHLREIHAWLLFLLPVGGLFIVWIYRSCGFKEDPGTNHVISSVYSGERLPFRMAPLIFISTVVTHLMGGSAGREGAALQIGGSLGATIGRAFRISEKDLGTVTMCGMSAVFSALFGTPLTASVFSMEVISIGVFHYSAFVPCIISAIVAYFITGAFAISPTSFVLHMVPELTPVTSGRVILLAAACAVLSILFCVIMHGSHHVFQRLIKNPYLRIVAGALIVIGLTLLVGRDYNGAGMNIVSNAIHGTAKPEAFLWKMIFTAVTLGVGFKGGEIVPTFFVGATFGNVIGALLGMDPGFSAAVGLVSMFCSVVNCPLASILLSVELFGSGGILLFGLACAVSYTLSGYYGLYGTQKILYSKLRTEYINRFTK